VDVLINAFARLQQLYQNLSLDIVGDGDQRFMFEQLVNSL
jgi:glycosyltransferase involved in cell wall biosynthesis